MTKATGDPAYTFEHYLADYEVWKNGPGPGNPPGPIHLAAWKRLVENVPLDGPQTVIMLEAVCDKLEADDIMSTAGLRSLQELLMSLVPVPLGLHLLLKR